MISVLGVDVGGTKVVAGPVDREGTQLAPSIVALTQTSDVDSFLSGLEATLRRALAEFDRFAPGAIGLACAGTVDNGRGEVVTSPNLPLVDIPLAPMLQVALGMPVVLENDGNAAVLAEAVAGAAVGLRHVVMLTLGTGVGSGLFLDGKLYRGTDGGAGELGHTVVQMGGLPCRCGNRGCLEMYASGPALARYASARARDLERDPNGTLIALRERGELNGGVVARMAREGHPGAVEAVRQLSDWLGIGLVNITNTFDPEMIVIGGGVGELGELLLHPARDFLQKNAMPPGRDHVKVASAKLGNKAGMVGGGLAAWEALDGRHEQPSHPTATPEAEPGAGADG
jgi:glucokinase